MTRHLASLLSGQLPTIKTVVPSQHLEPSMSPEEMIAAGWEERLARQESSLDELRRRAVQLLAAALVVAGIFAAAGAEFHGWQLAFRSMAITVLLGLVFLVSLIEWPRTFEFDQDTSAIAELVAQYPGHYSAAEVAMSLTIGRETSWNRNKPKLDLLHRCFTLALIAAGLQSLLWAVATTL